MTSFFHRSGRRQTSLVVAKGNSEATPAGASRARDTTNHTEVMSSGSEDADASEGGSGTNRNMSGHNDAGAESASGKVTRFLIIRFVPV